MMKKRILAGALVLVMAGSLAACGGDAAPEADTTAADTEAADEDAEADAEASDSEWTLYERTGDHDADSEAIYMQQLGNFYEAYEEAKEEEDLSTRYAKMAIAEAYLLEDCVFTPTTADGGYYGIRRTVPHSITSVTWGSQYDDYSKILVTNELIKAEDYEALKSLWSDDKGQGTYIDDAKAYLDEHGYTLKDTYTFNYSTDPVTWDPFTSFLSSTTEATINTTDHLLVYDYDNELQPALAESYEVSDDGLTYTFHLRQGVKWVDSQGREIGELTADDFLAGMQHFLDAGSGAEYLAGADGANIVNADAYTEGTVDFDEVGVKALDDYTVEYTLEAPCSFFMTLLDYTTFEPLCRSYYESQGGAFGADYDSTSCKYGIDSDHIAYCGPYIVASATASNSIVFQANESYWNADNVNIKTITWLYNDGSDPTKSYNDCLDGTIDGASLTASTLEIAKEDGNFDTYAVASSTDASAFMIFDNLNRQAFANTNDSTKAVSTETDEQKDLAYAALNNVHFRRALACALDRTNYNAQTTSEELGALSLINSYTAGTFVSLENDVTIAINGTDTTFPAGTWYGEIIQAQLDADEFPIQAFDTEADDGIGSGSGYDGWYNVEYAQSEMEIAIEELAAAGYDVSADNPVVLDYPTWTGYEIYANKGNAYKQSVESNLNNLVQINLVEIPDEDTWYYTQYYVYEAEGMNFDLGDQAGWSPDFGDPSTFLETMMPDYIGYCTTSLGLY